jgi:circadian clock protein KaiC
MSSHEHAPDLPRFNTGVPGLDEVLGGGLPQYSLNVIAGSPGTGKTTLAHQIAFSCATPDRRALYLTVFGEPPLKMLRYQRQMQFLDPAKVGAAVCFADLGEQVKGADLGAALAAIMNEVRAAEPQLVVVDSFRTLVSACAPSAESPGTLFTFLHQLALELAAWQTTTLLVGEYVESEINENPVFSSADAIIWLTQSRERNSTARKLQVTKIRGQASMPGLHTFRISGAGLQVFPRIHKRRTQGRPVTDRRLSTGIDGLDGMLRGGIPQGDSLLIAGPSGVGKTCFGAQFLAAGLACGEPGVLLAFEEPGNEYLLRTEAMHLGLTAHVQAGKLKILSLRPLDLSVDETLYEVTRAVESVGAQRLVIDSLSGFEVALAPDFREDFRESLYRMVGALTSVGVTIVMTVEVVEEFHELRFSPHVVSFLTDDILLLRYTEIEGTLRRVLMVVKTRRSSHSTALHEFEVTQQGIVVKGALADYQGILTGSPRRQMRERPAYSGLTSEESAVLQSLLELEETTEEALEGATGLPRPAVEAALRRLRRLNYGLEVVRGGRTFYRPIARALGL